MTQLPGRRLCSRPLPPPTWPLDRPADAGSSRPEGDLASLGRPGCHTSGPSPREPPSALSTDGRLGATACPRWGRLVAVPRRPGSAPSLAAPPLPTIHLARDHTTPEVARQVRDGAWVRVRPAAYIATEPGQDPNARRQTVALAQIVALREQLSTDYTLSHESAALLWGLPLLRTPTRTHIIQGWQPKSTHHDLVRHVHRLAEEHQVVHRGHPVTTLERTVVDCAMALGAHAGLVLADAALRAGADRGRCKEILTGMAGRHGAPVARAVLDLADDGAESPGESSARFVLLRAGLPVPETQVRVDSHLGTFWADLG